MAAVENNGPTPAPSLCIVAEVVCIAPVGCDTEKTDDWEDCEATFTVFGIPWEEAEDELVFLFEWTNPEKLLGGGGGIVPVVEEEEEGILLLRRDPTTVDEALID